MDPRTEPGAELAAAWRALSGEAAAHGWRTIAVAGGSRTRVLAGRRHPDNAEAVLVNLDVPAGQLPSELPVAAGFLVERVELVEGAPAWLALVRQPGAGIDLFTLMCTDVTATVAGPHAGGDAQALLARIRAWLQFMQRSPGGLLGPEAEVGLHGELVVLQMMLDRGLAEVVALDAWTGPLDGLHDFVLGVGAIEVKASLLAQGFPARIASLDQLDPLLASPLHVAAVALRPDPAGHTLGARIDALRARLRADEARRLLETRLLQAGWLESRASHYTRRLGVFATRFLEVGPGLPHLTRSTVPAGVTDARYTIDLAQATAAPVDLTTILAPFLVT